MQARDQKNPRNLKNFLDHLLKTFNALSYAQVLATQHKKKYFSSSGKISESRFFVLLLLDDEEAEKRLRKSL